MSRIRYLKPEFFEDEDLAELPFWVRLLFAGLWNIADKEGRLEDRPKRIKIKIFPYDDKINVEKGLEFLTKNKSESDKPFILRYRIEKQKYIQIVNWHKHQKPHHMELPSEIPSPEGFIILNVPYPSDTIRKEIYERDNYLCRYCGTDLRNEPRKICLDHVIPISRDGSNSKNNLATSCKKCNAKKLDKTPEEAEMKCPKGLGEIIRQEKVDRGLTGGITGGQPPSTTENGDGDGDGDGKDKKADKESAKHPKDKKSTKKQEKDYGSQELLSYFGKKYKEQFNITYFASFKKEITLFNNLLKLYNPPHILDLIDIFFVDVKKGKEEEKREGKDSKESKWVADKASVGVFFSQVNKLNISLAKIRDDSRRKDG